MLKKIIIAIISLILISLIVVVYIHHDFMQRFDEDVKSRLLKSKNPTELLTESDLVGLPTLVQNYIKKTNSLNRPKINNMKVYISGEMRNRTEPYFPFTSVQYNFFDQHTRYFFLSAILKDLRVLGYHKYENQTASMSIRLFGVFPVVNEEGASLNKAETVTVFSEMCLLAPGTLIDKRIKWKELGNNQLEATFVNGTISIKAILTFDDVGFLSIFESDDRFDVSINKNVHFRMMVDKYITTGNYFLMQNVLAIYDEKTGPFVYGKFKVESIEYNTKK